MPLPNRAEIIIFVSLLAWVFLLGPLMMYLVGEQSFQLTKAAYAAGVVILSVIGVGSYIIRIIREHGISTLIYTLLWILAAILLSTVFRSLFFSS